MAKIAEIHGVSSGIVHSHIKKHNKELELCARASVQPSGAGQVGSVKQDTPPYM